MKANRTIQVPDRTFEAVLFDWQGTAVTDRRADASHLRDLVHAYSLAGVHVFVVSGTDVDDIDDQLKARPRGRGRLHLCCNGGSEIFEVTEEGPLLLLRRAASAEEEGALDRSARETVERLAAHGLVARLVPGRLNRRKIDLIPQSTWAELKKAGATGLAEAVLSRLSGAGIAGLDEVVNLATDCARSAGISDPKITSDVKHVEIGLTDTSDAARFAATWLATRGITGELILVGGDEFGTVGGVPGGDALMMVEELDRAVFVSVGIEPGSEPDRVVHLGGGPARFLELLEAQLVRRRGHRVPTIDRDPAWVLPLPLRLTHEAVAASLATLGNGLAADARHARRRGTGRHASLSRQWNLHRRQRLAPRADMDRARAVPRPGDAQARRPPHWNPRPRR